VVIGLPIKSYYDRIKRIAAMCEEQGIIVKFLADMFNLKFTSSEVEQFRDVTVVPLYTGNRRVWPVFVKRLFDFCFSLFLLIALAPLLLCIAFLIKVTCGGPALFIQERLGLNKRRFRLYKFRTMVQDAEKLIDSLDHLNEFTGPAFKIKNDPRLTRVGKYLRKFSLDELPQLINVLKGDMSLVGPRPLPFRDYSRFDQDWQRRRFSVRPGITCLWQIHGRNTVSFDKWMELDMQYIDNWSILLDLLILIKTIPAVLKGQGAY
jgi:exopolysaccharide biosynthesis polyprenyl glycosylphosphotransferase